MLSRRIRLAAYVSLFAVIANARMTNADPPARTWRELISVSITKPEKVTPLWINQSLEYAAATNCVDQFSDDGGATWHDFEIDTHSPRPTIVWSTTLGSFSNYSGERTFYTACSSDELESEGNFSVYASAVTSGNDIYGVPATIDHKPPFADAPTTHPTSMPVASTQPATFDSEIAAARAAPDRDSKISHFRAALALCPNDPANLAIEFHIASMLCVNLDVPQQQAVHPDEALVCLNGILARYDHHAYYRSSQDNATDDPQLMIPRSRVLAASILLAPHAHAQADDTAVAGKLLDDALSDLQWTLEHRRVDWLNAPRPTTTPFDGMGRGVRHLKGWEESRRIAGSDQPDDVMKMWGIDANVIATSVIWQEEAIASAEKPDGRVAAMRRLIRQFPKSPIATIAQHEIDTLQ